MLTPEQLPGTQPGCCPIHLLSALYQPPAGCCTKHWAGVCCLLACPHVGCQLPGPCCTVHLLASCCFPDALNVPAEWQVVSSHPVHLFLYFYYKCMTLLFFILLFWTQAIHTYTHTNAHNSHTSAPCLFFLCPWICLNKLVWSSRFRLRSQLHTDIIIGVSL